ncbi:thioredoxin domain-containing protein [Candidatus Micrarchaeota archaeon]|nr:thioredoxin domain-containing protein [Candidatus Micrarchaeota archaeon]
MAFVVLGVMSVFSAKYRPLAKEAFRCVFRTVTFRPCDTGLDDRIKAEVLSRVMRFSLPAARLANRHFQTLSWVFVLLTLGSLAYSALGIYNFYQYGNCDGPQASGACILNYLTSDYGRFSSPTELIAPNDTANGIVAGDLGSNVTVVEFGCFTCPYTKQDEPAVQALIADGSVKYIFKPFPLPGHPYSRDAANAVLCADRQGKSWELRKLVFDHQEACAKGGVLPIKILAENAGLNMTQFDKCFDGNLTSSELDHYIAQGKASHIYATPTFFINGKPFVGVKSIEELREAVRRAKAGR